MPFFPVSDDNPHDTVPYITYITLIINIAVFLLTSLMPEGARMQFVRDFGTISMEFFQPDMHKGLIPEWATLLTSCFLHSGILHLFGNMWFLIIFADNIEAAFGHVRYFIFIVVAAALSSFLQALMMADTDIPTIGYSGIVAAILGAYFVLYPKAKINLVTPLELIMLSRATLNFSFYMRAFWIIPLWFTVDFWRFLQNVPIEDIGIAYVSHITGFIFGCVTGKLLHVNHGRYELQEMKRRQRSGNDRKRGKRRE